jgi:hypothetical protein
MADDHDHPSSEARRSPEPTAIERIEIVDQPPGGAALFVWTSGARDPIALRFDERSAAIAYVRDIWERRQDNHRREDDD